MPSQLSVVPFSAENEKRGKKRIATAVSENLGVQVEERQFLDAKTRVNAHFDNDWPLAAKVLFLIEKGSLSSKKQREKKIDVLPPSCNKLNLIKIERALVMATDCLPKLADSLKKCSKDQLHDILAACAWCAKDGALPTKDVEVLRSMWVFMYEKNLRWLDGLTFVKGGVDFDGFGPDWQACGPVQLIPDVGATGYTNLLIKWGGASLNIGLPRPLAMSYYVANNKTPMDAVLKSHDPNEFQVASTYVVRNSPIGFTCAKQ